MGFDKYKDFLETLGEGFEPPTPEGTGSQGRRNTGLCDPSVDFDIFDHLKALLRS